MRPSVLYRLGYVNGRRCRIGTTSCQRRRAVSGEVRALVARSWALKEFSVEDIPDPEPGTGEVLVSVTLAGLSLVTC